jgi:hypothetical protein
MKRTAWIIGLCLLFVAAQAEAFEGYRRGFVLGGGLGFTPSSSWSGPVLVPGSGVVDVDETQSGPALNLIVGGGLDEQNLLVFEVNGVRYTSNELAGTPRITQAFAGPAWYHYYGPMGRTFYTAVGMGLMTFEPEDDPGNDAGLGFLFGAGYEFAPHWQFGTYLSVGESSFGGSNYDHSQVSVLLGGVAF